MLGVLDVEQIVREDDTRSDECPQDRYNDPAKESLRWQRTVDRTEARASARARLIHVRDREADDYEQLCDLVQKHRRFVQRMRQPRVLSDAPQHAPEARKVDEAMRGLTGIFEREVQLSARGQSKMDARPAATQKRHPARRSRLARLRFDACSLHVKRPNHAPKHLPQALPLHVVYVREIDVPDGADPVEWYLLTTEPVETVDQVLRVVDIYRARWLIEEFNKALQTGCQYEKLQLESHDRLWTMLAFYCPIATHLLALREMAHRDADAPASDVLGADELEVLCAERPKLRIKPLTVQAALLAIASLGGHFTWNGPPGWLVLLRGMVTLQERTVGWRLAHMHFTRGPP